MSLSDATGPPAPAIKATGSKTIGRAALVVSVGILLSRVLGYLRNVVILSLLGVSAESSLYTYAFTIPDYLTFLMAGGYLSITLVPLLSRHLATGDEPEAIRTFTAVFRLVGAAFALFALVTVLEAGPIVGAVFREVDDQARLTSLTRIALASQVFFGLGTLLMAAQYSRRRFTIPSLAPLIYNLAIIGGGLVGWLVDRPSPEWFLWGGLVGAAVGNFGVQWLGARRAGFRLVKGVPWFHPSVREYFVLALPLMVGLSAVALDEQWPRYFGQFVSKEASAALSSARQLNMLPVGMIAQAAGVAAYPFLAGLAAEGRQAELGATVGRSVRTAVAVGALAAGVLAGLTLPVVTVAYGHGKVTADNLDLLSVLLLWYSVSIPFWAAHQVYTRGFYAMRRMWVPVVVGSAVTAVVVPVLFFTTDRFGAPGVAAGSTFGVLLYTVCIAAAWHRLVSPAEARSVLWFAVRALAVAAVAAAACFGANLGLDAGGVPSLLRLVMAGPVGVLAYLGLARVAGIDEINTVVARLASRAKPALSRLAGAARSAQ
jgi:putative peptidoglycan lipid II flippase